MGLFDQFPYTNFHELNLMWILQALKEIQTTTEQFVAINSLKYADPIQWNITSQYEKNTIVIDPQTGTAYISVQPVPSGVALTNSDYWTIVFDLSIFVTKAAQNLTVRYEPETTLTATFPTTVGQWLVWGDTLYIALVNITAGDSYVENSNIKKITVEEIKDEIYTTFNTMIGDLDDLDTTDKSNLVAAINEVASQVLGKIGDLDDLDTTDKSNLVAAINEVVQSITDNVTALNNIIGDLDDLDTTDKTSTVAAINDVLEHSVDKAPVNVLEHGVVGDGTTDDTTAFQYIVNHYDFIYIPRGANVRITSQITISHSIRIIGAGMVDSIVYNESPTSCFRITARGVIIENLTFECANDTNIAVDITVGQGTINNCRFHNYKNGIRMNNTSFETISNCIFSEGTSTGSGIIVGESQYCTGITIIGTHIWGSDDITPYCGILFNFADGVDIISCIINRVAYNAIIQPVDNGFCHSVRFTNVLFDGVLGNGVSILNQYADSDIFCITFDDCWFTAKNTETALQIRQTAGTIQNIAINNSEFISGYYGMLVSADDSTKVTSIRVSNCAFTDIVNTAINVGHGQDVIIRGCTFDKSFNSLTPTYPDFAIQIGVCTEVVIADNISIHANTNDLYVVASAMRTTYLINNHFAKSNFKFVGATADMPSDAPIGSTYESTDERTTYRFNGSTWTRSAIADVSAGLGSVPAVQGKMHFSTDLGSLRVHNGTGWGMGWKVGTTAQRPGTGTQAGDMYFDTSLGKPIWCSSGGVWVDATGTAV